MRGFISEDTSVELLDLEAVVIGNFDNAFGHAGVRIDLIAYRAFHVIFDIRPDRALCPVDKKSVIS